MDTKYTEYIINILKIELNKIYLIEGNSDKVVYLSQQLDIYILQSQKELIDND